MPDILGFLFYDAKKGITHFVEGQPGLGIRTASLCGISTRQLVQTEPAPLPLSSLSDKENICSVCLDFLNK